MIQALLLIEDDQTQDFRTFYFNENAVNGVYVIDSELMGVILYGSDYVLKYNPKIYDAIINVLKIKTLGLN